MAKDEKLQEDNIKEEKENTDHTAKIISILALLISLFNTVWGISYTQSQDEKKNKLELIRTMDKHFYFIEEKRMGIIEARKSSRITKNLINELEKEYRSLKYNILDNKDRIEEIELELQEEKDRITVNKSKVRNDARIVLNLAEQIAYTINNDLYDKEFFLNLYKDYFLELYKDFKIDILELKKQNRAFPEFMKLVTSIDDK